ncbi:MAG: hypothetical protein ABI747_04180 [Candidatus Moraniibacteriota bacterium]
MKKVFTISSVLLILTLAFVGVYYFAFKNNASNPVADPVKKEAAKQEESIPILAPEGRLMPVMSEEVVGAVLSGERIFFYSKRDAAFKSANLEGREVTTLFSDLPGTPTRVLWSPKRDRALALVQNDSGSRWYSVSLEGKTATPLKPELSRLAWTNLGDGILYQYTDPGSGKGSLDMAAPDGSNWKKLADLGEGSSFITPVPQSSLISFWKHPNGLEKNRLETITLTGDGKKALFADRFGTDFLWSKDGNRLLVGSVTEKGKFEPSLGVANGNGGEYRDLLVPTLVSKTVWGKDHQTIFYALPNPFPREAVLPNDYYGKPIYTKDTFWKMDVTTGKKARLIPLDELKEGVDATDLFLSSDESTLFFTDRVSSRLYRISF